MMVEEFESQQKTALNELSETYSNLYRFIAVQYQIIQLSASIACFLDVCSAIAIAISDLYILLLCNSMAFLTEN